MQGPAPFISYNQPKSLEWQTFYRHDLPILVDLSQDVKNVSIRNGLNRSQTMALEALKAASAKKFQRVTTNGKGRNFSEAVVMSGKKYSPHIALKDLSSREIKSRAELAAKKEVLAEFNRVLVSQSTSKETMKYSKNKNLVQSIKRSLNKGQPIHKVAEKIGSPKPLIWSIALEEKSDQERFMAVNWGLRTWDHWSFNDVDQRFGDNWPGQIPAQLVAQTLFYFTREGGLVFDPMAGGGVVADTCSAFGRKCWSFDLDDRPQTCPEIEPHYWDPNSLSWPVKRTQKADLIFFDPPYFNKMAGQYAEESVSSFSSKDYLKFFRELFPLFKENSNKEAYIAFLNSVWRDF
jgi:DNA modification methylase